MSTLVDYEQSIYMMEHTTVEQRLYSSPTSASNLQAPRPDYFQSFSSVDGRRTSFDGIVMEKARSLSSDEDSEGSPNSQHPALKTSLYKTELCKRWYEFGTCRYGSKCQFAHGDHELRRVRRHPKYKTVKCRSYWSTGHCPYGQRCRFLHAEDPTLNGGLLSPLSPPRALASPGGNGRIRTNSLPAHLTGAAGGLAPLGLALPNATGAALFGSRALFAEDGQSAGTAQLHHLHEGPAPAVTRRPRELSEDSYFVTAPFRSEGVDLRLHPELADVGKLYSTWASPISEESPLGSSADPHSEAHPGKTAAMDHTSPRGQEGNGREFRSRAKSANFIGSMHSFEDAGWRPFDGNIWNVEPAGAEGRKRSPSAALGSGRWSTSGGLDLSTLVAALDEQDASDPIPAEKEAFVAEVAEAVLLEDQEAKEEEASATSRAAFEGDAE